MTLIGLEKTQWVKKIFLVLPYAEFIRSAMRCVALSYALASGINSFNVPWVESSLICKYDIELALNAADCGKNPTPNKDLIPLTQMGVDQWKETPIR